MIQGSTAAAGTGEAERAITREALLGRFLAGSDVPCPTCGYNLRDLATDTCPECGCRIKLAVSPGQYLLLTYLTGIIALSAGAGFGGLFVFLGILMEASQRGGVPDTFYVISGSGFAVHAGALCWWLRNGRKLQQLPALRWSLALACTLMPFALALVLSRYL